MDVSADEGGNGTEETPFRTPVAARDYIRQAKEDGTYSPTGYVVHIKEGDYLFPSGEGFVLSEEDSGTKECPVLYKAEGKVRFIGGEVLNLSDFSDSDNDGIFTYKFSQDKFNTKTMPVTGHSSAYVEGHIDDTPYYSLLCDEEYMTLARYPNDGYLTINSVTDDEAVSIGANIDSSRLTKWQSEPLLCAQGYWNTDYSDLATPITINNEQIVLEYAPINKMPKINQRFFVFNALSELDAPGEWYIDNDKDTVYYYPKDSNRNREIIISTLQSAVIGVNGASNIYFQGIDVVGGRKQGYWIKKCDNIVIDGSTITGVQGIGVQMYGSSVNCRVQNSDIHSVGSGGIHLTGGSFADGIKGNNIVMKNTIHDYSRVRMTYSNAVTMQGYDNHILYNDMYDAPHSAIGVRGNENKIMYNNIHDVLREASDMGAIYAGNTKSARGNVIAHNFIHDIRTDSVKTGGYDNLKDIQAIFLDDLQDGYSVIDNTFADIEGRGVTIQGGCDNIVTDNIFINVEENINVRATGTVNSTMWENLLNSDSVLTDGSYDNAPYNKYPNLALVINSGIRAPMFNIVKNNLTIGEKYDIFYSHYNTMESFTDQSYQSVYEASGKADESMLEDYRGKY